MSKAIPKSILIQGGRIIDPASHTDAIGDLLVTGGRIAGRGLNVTPPADCPVIHAESLIICPGFIDLHCHLRQPGFEEKETIATGTRAAAKGGFTTVCAMPNTNPPLDNEETITFVRTLAGKEGAVRVLPIACVTRGRQGIELANLENLAKEGAVAFSDDGAPVATTPLMQRALELSKTLGLPIIDHCEDLTLSAGGQMNDGILSKKLGLKGMPAVAEDIIISRDLLLAHLTGGHVHIAHVSTASAVELIRRAKDKGTSVTAEVTPHHLTLTEECAIGLNTNAKVNPPLRTEADIRALASALKDGIIDAIATDHAPHTPAEKALEFIRAPTGISGFETALGSLMALVRSGTLPMMKLIAALTTKPAKIINRPDLGTLKVGSPADVTIFDPEREWVVDLQKFVSKGKNTPLAGKTLRGRVIATIYGGRIVYQE
ncbi:MAG: dihydroorotase [Dehalococcoidales bacterium]|nr:dihydroorotase [Dehalococcoidales bacterium]